MAASHRPPPTASPEEVITDEVASALVGPVELADSYQAAGRFADAVVILERTLSARPNDPAVRGALQRARAHAGQTTPVAGMFDDVTQSNAAGRPGAARTPFGTPVSVAGGRAVPLNARGQPLSRAEEHRPSRAAADERSSDTDHETTKGQGAAGGPARRPKSGRTT